MARSIKKVAHDLTPLSDVVSELSMLVSELLISVKSNTEFKDDKTCHYFDDCIKATQKLAVSAKLIRQYIMEVNKEADRENIK